GDGFFKRLAREIGFDGVLPSNPVTFGVVTERADVRAFPSSRAVIKRPGGFDTFQYSSISPTEPVALLHRSGDDKWGFFQTRFARGWIRLDKVAFTGRDGITPGGRPIVVTGSYLAVYSDGGLRKEAARLPMGSVLYRAGRAGRAGDDDGGPEAPIPVRLPKKTTKGLMWATGYIGRGADFSEGFLPYTRRNVITQAFKMLGEEYGWGGRDGLRDCSAFVKDVFASMGVNLPRNSRQQAFAGDIRLGLEGPHGPEDIVRALGKAEPGITLLVMDGHVMLYLGSIDNRPHVIHQIYGYMEGRELKELKKASVTGLELGAGSKAGALKDRIRGVSEVRLPNFKEEAAKSLRRFNSEVQHLGE
ncbi:MAG: NlpC/P60 family protein, partial [Deltaproteobacteria bacterium]|nr:NlpC/P60 family protein [Deltaproteobacteria bacterium]